jgi:glutamate/tyrosine decarboxylase-like PLP-dependent enzyme
LEVAEAIPDWYVQGSEVKEQSLDQRNIRGPNQSGALWPPYNERVESLAKLGALLNSVVDDLPHEAVAPRCDPAAVRAAIAAFDFDAPYDLLSGARRVIDLLKGGMVHTMHPGYFGLFNPTAAFPGIIADVITAHLNPQLAVWSHAPVPVEIERRVIAEFAALFGWSAAQAAGHFTSGGAEANHTALLLALTRAAPDFAKSGSRAFPGAPRLYASAESHLAWLKIAHAVGIGRDALRLIGTDGQGRLSPPLLRGAIEADLAAGHCPVFIAATAGTTNAGMIDPIIDCAAIARARTIWLHVDAAWGGAVAVLPEGRAVLDGIDSADSITVDAHKWLSVPMGAGMFLCRHPECLGDTFKVTANYMPAGLDSIDPYTHSMQWSRRFIGLKLFLTLVCIGWDGYRTMIRRALLTGADLSNRLEATGWRVVNNSPLAVLCFVDSNEVLDLAEIAARVVADGRAWISTARFEQRTVLRACVGSHLTSAEQLDRLIAALDDARSGAALP